MIRLTWFGIFIAIFIQGCGSLDDTTQSQGGHSRTYTVDKAKLMTTVQSFGLSNEFRSSVWNERSGHVTAERNEDASHVIVMNMDVIQLDKIQCKVVVDFSFRSGATSQEDRIMLVEWYDKFFNYLDNGLK